jgi:hypothetical protein
MLIKLAPTFSRATKQGKPKGVIFISQARTKFGAVSFGPTTRPTGGRMLGHLASSSCHFYLKEIKKVGGLPTMSTHTFTLDKNRLGLSRRSGDYSFYMRAFEGRKPGEPEESKTILSIGKDLGLIEKAGTGWKTLGKTFTNLNQALELIGSDSKFRESLKDAIMKKAIEEAVVVGEEVKDE